MTKRTSTWIAVAIVAMAILLAYNFYLLNKTQTASDEKAATVKPFYTMTRIQYVEKKLATKKDELESRTYEVVFNDKGHFRTEVVDGPSKGSLAIWNRTMFREYDATGKLVNETKAGKSVSAPRPFLSRGFNEQILAFINKGDFGQVEGEADIAGMAADVYVKKNHQARYQKTGSNNIHRSSIKKTTKNKQRIMSLPTVRKYSVRSHAITVNCSTLSR